MKIPSTLPITAEQSRAARFQLGLTQANVIEESGLPGHKLKHFETGRFVPDMPFLQGLRDYYAGKGIDFTEPASPASAESQPQPVTQPASPGAAIVRPISRMAFYVRDDLPQELVDTILERMDKNDERIADIMKSPVVAGFLGGYSDDAEAKQREIFGAMAENHLLFRALQGRDIVSAPGNGPSGTHADLVAKFFAASPLAGIASHYLEGQAKRVVEVGETDSEGGDE